MTGDVVYVVPYFPADLGGVERTAEQLAMRIAARRRVTVLTSAAQSAGEVPPEYPPAMTVRRLRTFRVAQIPFMPRLARELVETPRSSILHVHVSQAYAPEVVWLVSRLTRRPFVAHFLMDVAPSSWLGPIFTLYKKVVLSRVLRAATRVVVVSTEQARLVEDRYGVQARRISVVPNGVSAEFLAMARRPDLRQGPMRLLTVGAPEDPAVLTQALIQVHSDVELVMAGSDAQTADMVAQVRAANLANVRMVRGQEGDASENLYTWADALLLISDAEDAQAVVVEAMAAGLPVVARESAGGGAAMDDDDALITPATPEGLAAAIDRLATEPELRAELSRKGQARARTRDWDRLVEAIESVYRAVAG